MTSVAVATGVAYKEITGCRVCQSTELQPVVSLGEQYIVDFVDSPLTTKKPAAPLVLVFCKKCTLVQLKHMVNPELMYRQFWYRSGTNELMRAALKDIVKKAITMVRLAPGSNVLDIGSNDGTLLGFYSDHNVYRLGVDPSDLATEAVDNKNCEAVIQDYWNPMSATEALKNTNGEPFSIITAIAMFYDLNDPLWFLETVQRVLAPDGLFIVQMNYLGGMVKNLAFDNIVHEHATYFSLTSFLEMIKMNGKLEVVDVELNAVNGGSIRIYMTHKGAKLRGASPKERWDGTDRISDLIANEKTKDRLHKVETYHAFGNRITEVIDQITSFVAKTVAHGKTFYLYGASTRGTSLLQALPPGAAAMFPAVAERDEHKFGKFMVGSWVVIDSEEHVRERADWMMILPWHFLTGILEREKEWGRKGGKFLVPLPEPTVFEWNKEIDSWSGHFLHDMTAQLV